MYQKRNGIHFAFDEIDNTQKMYQKENSVYVYICIYMHILGLFDYFFISLQKENPGDTRDIRKVRQTQHQNPEFGHTQVRLEKNLQKSTLAFYGVKLRKPSILVVN